MSLAGSGVHREYLAAGAEAIKTNTFGLPRMAAARQPDWQALARAGWKLAVEAAGETGAAVFADLGPAPDTEAAPAGSIYTAVARCFVEQGAKNFLFETLSSDAGVLEAVQAVKAQVPDAFVLVSFAVLPDGYTREGMYSKDLVRRMTESGIVDAVGFNCVSAPGAMRALMQQLGSTALPLSVMPNAGYPVVTRTQVKYQGKPEYFAKELARTAAEGVKILGGCCGTTPAHIARSTVGTVTEIYDYLRLLYARIGIPHCPVCGRVISQQTVDEMVDAVLKLEEGTKFQVLAPVVRQRKGTQQKELDAARRGGYSRVRIDGNLYDLDEEISLEKNVKHTVEIVVDRLAIRKGIRGRLADSLETALALTGGIAEVDVIGGECMTFSQNFACPEHGISISDLSPRLFSFNNPLGACEKCTGLGTFMRVDEERILPNRNLSIREGAIKASGWYYAEGSVSEMYYLGLGKKYGFTLDTPIKEMST